MHILCLLIFWRVKHQLRIFLATVVMFALEDAHVFLFFPEKHHIRAYDRADPGEDFAWRFLFGLYKAHIPIRQHTI